MLAIQHSVSVWKREEACTYSGRLESLGRNVVPCGWRKSLKRARSQE
jgi:hypothetical protein